MIIFWRLILASLIADFVFQTSAFVGWKKKSLLGVLIHSIIHFMLYILFVYSYLNDTWIEFGNIQINGWISIAIISTIHFLSDTISRNSSKAKKIKSVYFLSNQLLHFLVIFIFSAPNLFAKTGSLFDEKTVLVMVFLLLTTYFATYFTHFLESDLFDPTLPFPTFDEKYLAISYRIIFYLLFLLPGYLWIIFIAIWLAVGIYAKTKRLMDISKFNFYMSFTLTTIFGILARTILYYG